MIGEEFKEDIHRPQIRVYGRGGGGGGGGDRGVVYRVAITLNTRSEHWLLDALLSRLYCSVWLQELQTHTHRLFGILRNSKQCNQCYRI